MRQVVWEDTRVADHTNHYERAFAAYLRSREYACVAVDESRRAFWQNETIKSLDFIVADGNGGMLLLDVKGRRLPRRKATRQNWVTEDDIQSLSQWQYKFGPSARGVFAFVFRLEEDDAQEDFTDRWTHEDRHYGCLTVSLADYTHRMRVRSPRWRTVNLRTVDFAEMARPLSDWFCVENWDDPFYDPISFAPVV